MTDRDLWTQSAGDLYRVLGVDADATGEQIRQAWHRQARATHPDTGGDLDRFRSVHIAYIVLSDPDQRARYDRDRSARRSPRARVHPPEQGLREPSPPPDLITSQEDLPGPWVVWMFALLALSAVALAYIWPPSSILTGTMAITIVVTRYVHHWRQGHPTL